MTKKFSVLIKSEIKKYNKKNITVDSDKSITLRCLFIAAQCIGISKITGLVSEDINATINGLRKLHIKILKKNGSYYVHGNGISGFKKFKGTLNFQNSATAARSMLGCLTCFPFPVSITGDPSLKLRPFKRLTDYLEKIGATILHPKNKKYTLPIKIHGTKDAAIQTKGVTEIIESSEVRDHTQRLLKSIKGDIAVSKNKGKRITKIRGQVEMHGFRIRVPADPSSSAFFCVQTLLSKKSSLLIKNVCVNDTRTGFIKILKKMGGRIKILNKKEYFGEPVADLFVQSSN